MEFFKNIIMFAVLFCVSQQMIFADNLVFNKTGQPITLTYYIDIPFTKKDKKAPFPSEVVLPLPEPFDVLPKKVDMHSKATSKVKASLACKDANKLIGTDLSCKKIKSVTINTPKIYELNDYELTIENDKLKFRKLNTIAGIQIKKKK